MFAIGKPTATSPSHPQWFNKRLRIPRASLVPASANASNSTMNAEKLRSAEAKTFDSFLNQLHVPDDREKQDAGRHSTASGTNLLTAANLAQMHKHQVLAMQAKAGTISHAGADVTLSIDTKLQITGPAKHPCNLSAIENQLDALSIASSTHFTMINGFGATGKKANNGRGCCCCKPIAAVIITMTGLLFLIVFGVIFLTEYPRMMAAIN